MPMFKKSLLILLVLVIAVVCGTMYGYHREQNAIALDSAVSEHVEVQRTVTVYVCGEVKKPGLVTLTEGQRVADAVNAVGGVIETADIDRINMATLLTDGMQVRVPLRIGGTDERSNPAGKNADGKINLNTASEKELQELPGIGPAMSARIVEYREEHGDFQNIEDVKNVRGIGNAKFEKMKDKVTI